MNSGRRRNSAGEAVGISDTSGSTFQARRLRKDGSEVKKDIEQSNAGSSMKINRQSSSQEMSPPFAADKMDFSGFSGSQGFSPSRHSPGAERFLGESSLPPNVKAHIKLAQNTANAGTPQGYFAGYFSNLLV